METRQISFTFRGIKGRDLGLDEAVFEALSAWFEAHPEDGAAAAVSRTKVRRLIMAGQVRVGGQARRQPGLVLHKGSHVIIALDSALFFKEIRNDDLDFVMDQSRIVFEDEWLIVVDKPACLPVEATVVEGRANLHQAVRDFLAARDGIKEPYLGMHHRLDRETSGLILFSREKNANPALHQAFLERQVHKTYLALTDLAPPAAAVTSGSRSPRTNPPGKRHPGEDSPEPPESNPANPRSRQAQKGLPADYQPGLGPARDRLARLLSGQTVTVENHLGRISPKSAQGKWGPVVEGDPAVTDFSLHQRLSGGLVLAALPHTGRTHQIRVHASGLGLPLAGDVLYGGTASHEAVRVMLHAWRLSLPHPVLGTALGLESRLPADFLACMACLDRR